MSREDRDRKKNRKREMTGGHVQLQSSAQSFTQSPEESSAPGQERETFWDERSRQEALWAFRVVIALFGPVGALLVPVLYLNFGLRDFSPLLVLLYLQLRSVLFLLQRRNREGRSWLLCMVSLATGTAGLIFTVMMTFYLVSFGLTPALR